MINVTLRAVAFKAKHKLSQDAFADYMTEQAATMSLDTSSHTHQIAARWLPKNWASALSMLEDDGACIWSKQVHYDQCMHCNWIYRLDHTKDESCQCGAPHTKEHTRNYIYQPLAAHIRRTYSIPFIAQSMATWHERRSKNPNKLTDILDVVDMFGYDPGKDTTFENDGRHISVLFSQDPFLPFEDDAYFSCAPSLAYFLNIPAWCRQEMFLAHVCGIGPGSRKRFVAPLPPQITKTHRHKFAIFADELNYLDTYGTRVIDSRDGKPFLCRARLVNCVADFRGMEDLIGINGSPSTCGCLVCWLRGQSCGKKMLYCGHRKFLERNDPLRAVLRDMHPEIQRESDTARDTARKTKRRRTQDMPCHLRAQFELATCAPDPVRPLPLTEGELGVTQLGG